MKRPNYPQCSGPEWDRIRIFAMARDNCTCQFHKLNLAPIENVCTLEKPEDRPRHLQVHHIQRRINGGTHDMDNLITICTAHHEHIHPHMRFDRAVRQDPPGDDRFDFYQRYFGKPKQ